MTVRAEIPSRGELDAAADMAAVGSTSLGDHARMASTGATAHTRSAQRLHAERQVLERLANVAGVQRLDAGPLGNDRRPLPGAAGVSLQEFLRSSRPAL